MFMLRIRYAISNCSRCDYRYVKFELDILKYIFTKKIISWARNLCAIQKFYFCDPMCTYLWICVHKKAPTMDFVDSVLIGWFFIG